MVELDESGAVFSLIIMFEKKMVPLTTVGPFAKMAPQWSRLKKKRLGTKTGVYLEYENGSTFFFQCIQLGKNNEQPILGEKILNSHFYGEK